MGSSFAKICTRPLLVAGEESVVGNDDGEPHLGVLADPYGHEVHVVDGLGAARHQDDPSGVEREVEVRVVAADVQGAAHRAVGDVQHHREARPRLRGKLLQRVQHALGGGGVQDPPSPDGGAVADPRRAVLAIAGDHPDLVLAVSLHGIERLGHLGGRRNRVEAHHVEVDVSAGLCGHLVAASEGQHLPGHRRLSLLLVGLGALGSCHLNPSDICHAWRKPP